MILSRRDLVGLLAIAALSPATSAEAKTTVLRGTVNFRERMALPSNVSVVVQLVDVSRADAPAEVIAEDRIVNATGSPIPYRLSFDHARINLRHRYALQARITDGDRLLFTTTKHHAIYAGGRNNTRILVHRVSQPASPATSPAGKWLAEDILGGGVIDRLQTVLEIAADGSVTGTGGCNRFRGKATINGDRINFGALAGTKMACTPAAMDQEHKFHQALSAAKSFRVQPYERRLILLNGAGRAVARLAAM
jgi:putative lipoprotein